MVEGMELRLPYQSDPTCRKRINAGEMEYIDIHLGHVAQFVQFGFLGKLDIALVEVTGILEDGRLIPSSSVGNNKTWLDQADKVILEVNTWQSPKLEGMHDIPYETDRPPDRKPIQILKVDDRIGTPYLRCPADKILAVVETNAPDRNNPFTPPDEISRRIAGHVLDFLAFEVEKGRLPEHLLPLQSGVGNISNAVLAGLKDGPFDGLSAYTEVIQDGMFDLMQSGKLSKASATAFSLSAEAMATLNASLDDYRHRIILRPQEISNHPGVVRRLGCLAMNGMIEADIYGNVNSTHLMGTSIQNGIGGSGDFAERLHLVLHDGVAGEGRGDLLHRPDGVARGSHRARRPGDRDRAGAGGLEGPLAQATGPADHREMCPPRFQAGAAGILPEGPAAIARQADPAPAGGGIQLARARICARGTCDGHGSGQVVEAARTASPIGSPPVRGRRHSARTSCHARGTRQECRDGEAESPLARRPSAPRSSPSRRRKARKVTHRAR